jgi:hypothetical protein
MQDPLMVGSDCLWPGRFHERLHISTRQYARIVRDWVISIGLEASAYGTHSMRRTKVTIYKKTGNLRAVQLLPDHTKMDTFVRSALFFPLRSGAGVSLKKLYCLRNMGIGVHLASKMNRV